MSDAISHGSGEDFTDKEGAEVYAKLRHGADGDLLLDPYIQGVILDYANDVDVVDIGAGAGPWAALAADVGANRVIAADIAPAMLERAKEVAAEHNAVELVRLDGKELPFPDEAFGLAMSINVGCAMNSTRMAEHFDEAFRVLHPRGRFIVTAPVSLEVPFTTDAPNAEDQLQKAMELVGEIDPEFIPETFATDEFSELLRVTFAEVDGKWQVVYGDELKLGQPIWRKLPGNLVVPNYWHTQDEYLTLIEKAGFTRVQEMHFPTAEPEDARLYGLSSEYCSTNAFAIFVVGK